MMNRRFTTREKILLIVCAVLLLGIFYYKVVYVDTIQEGQQYDISNLQAEYDIANAKVIKMENMRKEIASGDSELNGEVATYNNLQNEINELNKILETADTYHLDFDDATVTGETVRRNISVSFHTGSYTAAKNIVSKLSKCQYRCMIKELDISTTTTQTTGITSKGDLNISLLVTFYETTNGATTLTGLVSTEDSSSTDANVSEDTMVSQ